VARQSLARAKYGNNAWPARPLPEITGKPAIRPNQPPLLTDACHQRLDGSDACSNDPWSSLLSPVMFVIQSASSATLASDDENNFSMFFCPPREMRQNAAIYADISCKEEVPRAMADIDS
jgi:hypothetical protein